MMLRAALLAVVTTTALALFSTSVDARVHPKIIQMCGEEYNTLHDFVQSEKENGMFYKQLKKVLNESMCMPKPVLVPITHKEPGKQFDPDHVWVNRCKGACVTELKSCFPEASKLASIAVWTVTGGQRVIGYVQVEEHTKCTCDCVVKEEDCNLEKQVYANDSCGCICRDTADMIVDKTKCLEKQDKGFEWNMDLCECQCVKDTKCSTPSTWVPELCSCMTPKREANGNEVLEYERMP